VTALRAAFVMEQTLGHVTHHQNLALTVQRQSAVVATWIPIPFAASGLASLLPVYGSNWSLRASVRARRQLGKALSARRHDALFFHTQVTSLFSVGLMRRIPTVVSLDATPANYDSVGAAYGHRGAGDGWLDERKFRMNRDAFHAAAHLVTWSHWAKRSLAADYGVVADNVTVLAPGAAPSYFDIGAERLARTVSTRPVRLLFVGGDFARKGGPLLLEAFSTLTHPDVELHVVTSAAIEPRPRVVVHRDVRPNTPELHRLFREADVFVLPSDGECLAVALMEAAAAALPIVTTDVGALREAARDGENAFVIAPGDATALRLALERLSGDEALRRRLGAAGHALARELFDADTNDRKVLGLIADVVDRAPSRRVA